MSQNYLDLSGLTAYDTKIKAWSKTSIVDITDDAIRLLFVTVTDPADNEIWYTSTNGSVVNPNITDAFGANLVDNKYENGKGVITFDDPVTSIRDYAFWGCSSLTSITIPNSVTSIGDCAFESCSSLTSITIPNSVTSIGGCAFSDCPELKSIVVEIGNTIYDSRENCNAIIETVTNTLIAGCQNTIIPNSVTSIKYNAFYGCSSLTSITIPNSVTSIGEWAFQSCSSLTSINIPNSVTSIGKYAFNSCSSLTSITIPNSVTSIGESAFKYCSKLTYITIPNSVTSIRNHTFGYCSSLTSITIPNSVTSIGYGAFWRCDALNSITCEATTSPTLGSNNNLSSVTAVYVPEESVDAYKSANNWSYYASKIQPIQ